MTLPQPVPAPASFRGLRAAVVGFGIEGRDAALFLQQEAVERLQILDRRSPPELESELAALNLQAAVGSPDDLCLLSQLDAIVASQGIPRDLPLLQAAEQRGVPVFGPLGLFLDRCPSPVIGISGSAGKTTTTTLVGEMLRADGREPLVGGNIGSGLLSRLPELSADSSVVAEISHSQLLRAARSPQCAALLNVTPNHLDQFNWSEYVELKRRLISRQCAADTAVLPWDEPVAASTAADTAARVLWFGSGGPPPARTDAAWLENGILRVRLDGWAREILPAAELRIPGEHNIRNALAAIALCAQLGVPDTTIAETLRRFEGVPHRLETVAEVDGVRYINDSIATAPERTLAGIRAIDRPLVLLLGGRDKKLPLDTLIAELPNRAWAIVCFGEIAPGWTPQLRRAGLPCQPPVDDLADAVTAARHLAQPGDAVLLSPGGTSFDAYPNFQARGEHFRALVEALR